MSNLKFSLRKLRPSGKQHFLSQKLLKTLYKKHFQVLPLLSVCSLPIHAAICRHWAPPYPPLQSPGKLWGAGALPPQVLTKPITCGKPEQENKVDEHEATQVSQDHLQERAGRQNQGQAQAGKGQDCVSLEVILEPKWNRRTYMRVLFGSLQLRCYEGVTHNSRHGLCSGGRGGLDVGGAKF